MNLFFLAVAEADVTEFSKTGSPWTLVLILLLVLLNGLFVAAEFSLVKVRASQIDELVEEGRFGASFARRIINNLDAYLSATQLGITITSLGLGSVGEPYLTRLFQPVFHQWLPFVPHSYVHNISIVIGFSLITALHIVLGELVPKNLAIRRAVPTSLLLSRPLGVFHSIFKPVTWLLNVTARKLLKWIFRLDPVGENENVHSAEELRMLVTESQKEEEVTETESEILINALELSNLIVRDIMTPRAEMVAFDLQKPFGLNLQTAVESKHTRFPLIEGHLEACVGLVHIKDLLCIMGHEEPSLLSIKRDLLAVPEMMELDKLLKFFLTRHAHLALVVDEFGATIGMVTLDDVIEELVGEIQDEFDSPDLQFQRLSDDEFVVDGTFALYELAEHTDLELEHDNVSTIGGYITDKIGHLPALGEGVEVEGYDAVVTKTDGRRIVQLQFRRKVPSESPAAAG